MEGKSLDSSPPDLKLVAHPRAKSKVWKYFGFDTDADGCILQWKKIYCRICRAQIAYSGNTSNLSYHLEKNHPDEFCEFVKSNTEQMREAFATAFSKLKAEAAPPPAAPDALAAPKGAHGPEPKRQEELTAAVLGFLCEGLHPASIVDEPTFRALLKVADPWYELPGRKFFCGKAIPERYGALRAAVLKELADVPWCGLSADVWTSQQQNRTYLTLAAHFLRGDAPGGLSPGSRCLKTFEVPDENAAETITRVLYEAFIEWGLSDKVSGATVDGGRDVAKACSLLDIAVQVPCLGHAFDGAIRQALQLPKLAALLARCRRLVGYFQQSPVARLLLLDKQRQQWRAPCMLVSDRAPWWGRTLAMLRRLQEQQFVVAGVLLEDSNNHHLMLEAAEWATIEGLVEVLQPFQQVADMLSAAPRPTVSMVKPLLHMLLSTTLGVKDTDPKDVSLAKDVIAKALAKTYQDAPEVDIFLNVATFLDPRYKKLPFLSALERQQVENRVVEEAKALLDQARDGAAGGADDAAPGRAEEPPAKKPALPSTPPPASVINTMLAEIFCPAPGSEDQGELQAQVLEELSNFKSQKVLGLGEDPLRWWSDRLALFPVLPKVLRKYWSVSATCVPPRRLFGPAARAVSAKRSRLAPAHVDEQVFLYENLRGAAEPEPEDEDEGEWGLEQEQDQALTFGDAAHAGFFGGVRDGAGFV